MLYNIQIIRNKVYVEFVLYFLLCRHLSSQLTEMEKLVDKMLSTEFQRYATADLNRPLDGENIVLDGVSTQTISYRHCVPSS